MKRLQDTKTFVNQLQAMKQLAIIAGNETMATSTSNETIVNSHSNCKQ
jgi:hypothetical protein